MTVQVAAEDETLHLHWYNHKLPLVAVREDCYHNAEQELSVGFVAEPSVPVTYLVVDGDGFVRVAVERDVTAVRAQLDAARFAEAWGAGRALTLEQAVAYALEPRSEVTRPPALPVPPQPTALTGPSPASLTTREVEVLRLVAAGRSNHAIAEALAIEVGTVKRHVHSVLGKLEAQSRTEAVAHARALRLL